MQAGGDGFGWRVTAEHMTFQDPGVFIPCHICKVPGREEITGSTQNEKNTREKMRGWFVGLVLETTWGHK